MGGGGEEKNGDKKKENAVEAPAPACGEESTKLAMDMIEGLESDLALAAAPSPAPTDDSVAQTSATKRRDKKDKTDSQAQPSEQQPTQEPMQLPPIYYDPSATAAGHHLLAPQYPPQYTYMMPLGYYSYPPPPGYYQPHGPRYSEVNPGFYQGYDEYGQYRNALLEGSGYEEYTSPETFDGIEPIMIQLDHKLDIDIRDDQLIQQ